MLYVHEIINIVCKYDKEGTEHSDIKNIVKLP